MNPHRSFLVLPQSRAPLQALPHSSAGASIRLMPSLALRQHGTVLYQQSHL